MASKAFKGDDNEIVRVNALLISTLKITKSLNLASKTFRANNNKNVWVDSRANETVKNSFKNNKFRNLMYMLNIRAIEKLIFLIFNTKKVFNFLKQAFIKVLIPRRFDFKSYIQIKTDILSYTISTVLNQLNLSQLNQNFDASLNDWNKSDFSQWQSVAYFFKNIIPAETQY